MMNVLRSHGRRIAAGLLLAGVLGGGGSIAYARYTGSCCAAGSSCCYPGSPCCHGHAVAER